jgi:hypothetical protein
MRVQANVVLFHSARPNRNAPQFRRPFTNNITPAKARSRSRATGPQSQRTVKRNVGSTASSAPASQAARSPPSFHIRRNANATVTAPANTIGSRTEAADTPKSPKIGW